MSVTGANVVDAIGIDNETGQVVLTLADHLPWGERQHFEDLRAKLNTYLTFVESDELLESYPQARGRRIAVQVVCKFPPDAAGVEFFQNAGETIRGAGFDFSWSVFES